MSLVINIHLHHMLNKFLLVEETFQAQPLQETQKDFCLTERLLELLSLVYTP